MTTASRAGAASRLSWRTAISCLLATAPMLAFAGAFPSDLFGYSQLPRNDIADFPQWVQALERHLADDLRDGDCSEPTLNTCHLREWQDFLATLRDLPRIRQVDAVNRYANAKSYVLDFDNYGLIDYWAIPREFLFNGGDCEDYAITKMMSLRWLGVAADELRIVVLQDTNLRIPHAVMAFGVGDDILILDNQVDEVQTHRSIAHYAPVYSISETQWWLHVPGT